MILLFVFIWLFSQCIAHQRFRDDEMMIMHHNHENNTYQENLTLTEDFLQIHLIPHSHDDVGWLKTVDSYYYGANQSIQWAGVQYTIDTVVQALLSNPQRKFILVEIAFFYRWWNEQDDFMKDKVKFLINNKQLEFINGGWCMNDEADTYYEDIIDQMTLGHQYLLQNFGQIPSVGWHIDPFGHQSSQAAIFSQMGFNAMFFPRIDHQDKKKRMLAKSMEMVWHPHQDSGLDHYIFTHINYWYYFSPPNYCFDEHCLFYNNLTSNEPIMDDPRLEYYNVKQRADGFVYYFRNMSLHYRGKHLMHTMGFDFEYANAHMNYKNMDKLIKYINNHSDEYKMNITYNTPSEYIQIINDEQKNLGSPIYPTNYYDFLPYSDINCAYWTGYYTSRVAQKGLVKELGRYLQSTRTLLAFLFINQEFSKYVIQNSQKVNQALQLLEQVIAINQHHDAVAGTEKQWVTDDYIFQLNNASNYFNQQFMFPFLQEQTNKQIQEYPKEYTVCNWNSTSENCPLIYDYLSNNKTILLTVYNPSLNKSQVIRVKVPNKIVNVLDSKNQPQNAELVCSNQTDQNDCDLFFISQLQGFSLNYFKLVPVEKNQLSLTIKLKQKNFDLLQIKKIEISNTRYINITNQKQYKHVYCNSQNQCQSDSFTINYNYYPAYQDLGQKSGAYIFRPANKSYTGPQTYSKIIKKLVYQGNVVTIIHQIEDKIDSYLRFYNLVGYENIIELETFIHPIPVYDDQQGKEIVLDIDTNYDNNDTFYTDSNGLEMQQRIKNYRPTWQLQVNEPTSGNYYPVTSMIYIQDINSSKRLTILNDRSQGGTSLEKGRIELMLHRRLLYDDDRGVGEPLNELDYDGEGLRAKMRHYLVFNNNNSLSNQPRLIQKNNDLSPLQFYAGSNYQEFVSNPYVQSYLPSILQFNDPYLKIYLSQFNNHDKLSNDQQFFLLRLHNLNEINNATFQGQFTSINEMTLTANQKKQDWLKKQLKWNQSNNQHFNVNMSSTEILINGDIVIRPLEMKTFLIQTQQFTKNIVLEEIQKFDY